MTDLSILSRGFSRLENRLVGQFWQLQMGELGLHRCCWGVIDLA